MNQIITYILLMITSLVNISPGNININEVSDKLQNENLSQIISLIYQNTPIDSWCKINLSGENIHIWGKCSKEDFDKNFSDIVTNNIYTITDIIRPSISWWTSWYNQDSTEFIYTGSRPIFASGDLVNIGDLLSGDLSEKLYILSEYSDSSIYIPILDIKKYISDNYISRFVANRDIKLYSHCQKQNFDVAMKKLQSVKLSSGQSLNLNKELTNLSGYCMWSEWEGKYMFYQWVCGTSTLFFRNALVTPDIYISKRQWHSNRFTKYYGDYIYWDDAAIYEMDKQFEIQNKSDYNLYIKFWTSWDLYADSNKYLVSIYPWISNQKVQIIKKEVNSWELKSIVSKNIYHQDNLTTWAATLSSSSQTRVSNYYNKLYDTN